MKIEKIKLEGFKSIECKEYSFPEVKTILLGKNGEGKTSLLEAIRFVITGEFPADGINHNYDSASVIADFDTVTIQRIKSNGKTTVLLNDVPVTAKELDAVVENLFGLPKQSLKICTSGEVLTSLSSADLGNFLKTYIPEEMTKEILYSYIPGITEDEAEKIEEYLPEDKPFGIELLNSLYKTFFEERTAENRILKGLKATVESFTSPAPTMSLDAIDKQLAYFNSLSENRKVAENLLNSYNSTISRIAKIKEEIKTLQTKIANDSSSPVHPEAINIKRKKIKELEDNLVEKRTIASTLKKNIEMFNRSLANLNKPICPLSNKIVCTTDKSAVKAELLATITENEKAEKTIIGEITDITAQIKTLNEEMEVLIQKDKNYENKLRLMQQLADKKNNIPEIPTKPDIPEIPSNLNESIRMLKAQRDAIYLYKQHLENEKKYEEQLKVCTLLDSLVNIFSPKGTVMSEILGHYVSLFEDAINEKARLFNTDMQFMFNANNGIQYMVKLSEDSAFQCYESLSHGEQTVVMFLMLDLINSLTGLRIMIIDDLNHLDEDNMKKLMNLINICEANGEYDHIFLACVDIPAYRNILE